MFLLVIGVAVGLVITGLLRAWTRYEAQSSAALQEDIELLLETVQTLNERVESLEAIAAEAEAPARIDLDAIVQDTSQQNAPKQKLHPLK
jgi:Tfp pilus assembly protein PilN